MADRNAFSPSKGHFSLVLVKLRGHSAHAEGAATLAAGFTFKGGVLDSHQNAYRGTSSIENLAEFLTATRNAQVMARA